MYTNIPLVAQVLADLRFVGSRKFVDSVRLDPAAFKILHGSTQHHFVEAGVQKTVSTELKTKKKKNTLRFSSSKK